MDDQINKHVTNKLFLLVAGWLAPWAIIHHTGRRSGKNYRTPVMTFPTENGFLFALTYGRKVDWVRNLVTADAGVLEYKGNKIYIAGIQLKKFEECEELFPQWVRRSLRRVSVDDCLLAEAHDNGKTEV